MEFSHQVDEIAKEAAETWPLPIPDEPQLLPADPIRSLAVMYADLDGKLRQLEASKLSPTAIPAPLESVIHRLVQSSVLTIKEAKVLNELLPLLSNAVKLGETDLGSMIRAAILGEQISKALNAKLNPLGAVGAH